MSDDTLITEREKQLKQIIVTSINELRKLKGKQIKLCGSCYRKATPKHSCYGVEMNGRTDIKVYARGVVFREDGFAEIDWRLQ